MICGYSSESSGHDDRAMIPQAHSQAGSAVTEPARAGCRSCARKLKGQSQ